MQTDDRDVSLLWDMREAAKEAVEFVEGASFDSSAAASDSIVVHA